MKIKFLTDVQNELTDGKLYRAGEVADLPADFAAFFIAEAELAEAVEVEAEPEKAVKHPKRG